MDASSPAPTMEELTPVSRPPKRLIFDRRYGWVYDEWRDPSEVALAGGRGMFCIVPIVKAFLSVSSQLINAATDSAVRNLRNRNHTPQTIHANLCTQFQKLLQSIQTLVSRRRFPKQISNMTESHKS
ncbi:uncharacterized protein LOC120259184 [Dioscorea cayenensis subsp. rotundata]|uniref:Uncharacterized protein LOC120259184 n=1 Tax=Dioscorea cayennensis subsp. rotundata TaxID=55577 RepID=A0AB40B638_DIOCR|nr:uncharacterized protein LOC120259184 [Dioscorea cayenensis subsp. rotundata]